MAVIYSLHYAEIVVQKDIRALSGSTKENIKLAIEKKLTSRPELFGKPLRHSLKGYRTLRVQAYRVIFYIDEASSQVRIIFIGHRKDAYNVVNKRGKYDE